MEMYALPSTQELASQRPARADDEDQLLDRVARDAAPDVRALAELLATSPRVALDGEGRLAALADGLRVVAMAELAREYLSARSTNERSVARAAFSCLAKGTPHVVWANSAGALVKASAGGRNPARVAQLLKRSVAAMMGVASS